MALLRRIGAAALLWALGALPAAAQDREVGRVVQLAPKVHGRHDGQTSQLAVRSPVFQGMEVETYRRAGARIAINTQLPHRKGMVVLGPETRVELTNYVVDAARGLPVKMSWRVKIGNFRVALFPRPYGSPPGEGEYVIRIGEGEDAREIRLAGTDVAVHVAPEGTAIVRVLEGEVMVKGREGAPVRIPAGHQVRVPPRGEPQPPVRFDPCPDMIHAGMEAQVHFTHGVLAFANGDNEKAASLFRQAAFEGQDGGTFLHWQGLAELRLGKAQHAVDLLEKSLKARQRPAAGRERVEEHLRIARQAVAGGTTVVEAPPYQPEVLCFGIE